MTATPLEWVARHGLLIDRFVPARGLVAAIIDKESGGDPTAWRPEPTYGYLWNVTTSRPFRVDAAQYPRTPPPGFPSLGASLRAEWDGQRASWGLMQVMGAVAREYGCRRPYLTALVAEPALSIEYGCRYLARLLDWAGGDVAQAVAAYNAGQGGWHGEDGQAYARDVLARQMRME